MAKKLSAVLSETKADIREITVDEAKVLASLGMSGAEVNDKARKAMTYFLEALTLKDTIEDDEAKAALDVLKQSATVEQKALCNRVLLKYVSKFDFAQPGAHAAAKLAKAVNEAKEFPVAA